MILTPPFTDAQKQVIEATNEILKRRKEVHEKIIKLENKKDILAMKCGYLEYQKRCYFEEMDKIGAEIAELEKEMEKLQ